MRPAKPALILIFLLAFAGVFAYLTYYVPDVLPEIIEARWQGIELMNGFGVRERDNTRFDVLWYLSSATLGVAALCAMINARLRAGVREGAWSLFEPAMDPGLRMCLAAVAFVFAASLVFLWIRKWILPAALAAGLVFALDRLLVDREISQKLWKRVRLAAFACIALCIF